MTRINETIPKREISIDYPLAVDIGLQHIDLSTLSSQAVNFSDVTVSCNSVARGGKIFEMSLTKGVNGHAQMVDLALTVYHEDGASAFVEFSSTKAFREIFKLGSPFPERSVSSGESVISKESLPWQSLRAFVLPGVFADSFDGWLSPVNTLPRDEGGVISRKINWKLLDVWADGYLDPNCLERLLQVFSFKAVSIKISNPYQYAFYANDRFFTPRKLLYKDSFLYNDYGVFLNSINHLGPNDLREISFSLSFSGVDGRVHPLQSELVYSLAEIPSYDDRATEVDARKALRESKLLGNDLSFFKNELAAFEKKHQHIEIKVKIPGCLYASDNVSLARLNEGSFFSGDTAFLATQAEIPKLKSLVDKALEQDETAPEKAKSVFYNLGLSLNNASKQESHEEGRNFRILSRLSRVLISLIDQAVALPGSEALDGLTDGLSASFEGCIDLICHFASNLHKGQDVNSELSLDRLAVLGSVRISV